MDTPPLIEPDTKSWTWVLERPCPECGFAAATVDPRAVADLLRANTREWVGLLGGDAEEVRRRPSATTWSALEYGAHVRDVHRLYLERLELMLTEDGPHFADWNQDATAVTARYHETDPARVAAELGAAAAALAARFDSVEGAAWNRTGHRSDGATFTVASFARYFVHDPVHHVHDVREGFARLAG